MNGVHLQELKEIVPNEVVYKRVDDKELHLYIFPPKQEVKGCIISIHGGGFGGGTPRLVYPNAGYFSECGGLGVCVEYRLQNSSEGYDVRQCLEDCADALDFIRKYVCDRYGEIPMIAFGDSAGAYLAACLGCQTIIDRVRKGVKRADFVVDCNGIPDLTGKWGYAIEVKEDDTEDRLALQMKYSPIFNIEPTDADVLIIHGDSDDIVDIEDSRAYHKKLLEKGVRSEMTVLPNARHAFILFDYVHDNSFVGETLYNIVTYLKNKKLL